MKIEVEKGIPIPDSPHRATGIIKAMKKMRFGDSPEGKARSSRNRWRGGQRGQLRALMRELLCALDEQNEALDDIEVLLRAASRIGRLGIRPAGRTTRISLAERR